jgi:hypothetical protein
VFQLQAGSNIRTCDFSIANWRRVQSPRGRRAIIETKVTVAGNVDCRRNLGRQHSYCAPAPRQPRAAANVRQ